MKILQDYGNNLIKERSHENKSYSQKLFAGLRRLKKDTRQRIFYFQNQMKGSKSSWKLLKMNTNDRNVLRKYWSDAHRLLHRHRKHHGRGHLFLEEASVECSIADWVVHDYPSFFLAAQLASHDVVFLEVLNEPVKKNRREREKNMYQV